MKKVNPTPAPWRQEGCEIIGADGTAKAKVICSLSFGSMSPAPRFSYIDISHMGEADITNANARLIAASPDLLAACKKAMDVLNGSERGKNADLAAIDACRNAIDKAEGRT